MESSTEIVGKSYFGENIILKLVGSGGKTVLFTGDFWGNRRASHLLYRWMEELVLWGSKGSVGKVNVPILGNIRRILVLPSPNPDAEAIRNGELSLAHPFYGKIKELKERAGSSCVFKDFRCNGKGVEIGRNFPVDFEAGGIFPMPFGYYGDYPGSETEVRSFSFLVKKEKPLFLVSLTEGQGLSAPDDRESRQFLSYGLRYALSSDPTVSFSGTPEAFFTRETGRAALRIGVDFSQNEEKLYEKLRFLLFSLSAY